LGAMLQLRQWTYRTSINNCRMFIPGYVFKERIVTKHQEDGKGKL